MAGLMLKNGVECKNRRFRYQWPVRLGEAMYYGDIFTLLRKRAVINLSDMGSQDIKLQYAVFVSIRPTPAVREEPSCLPKKRNTQVWRSVDSAPQPSSFTHAQYVDFISRELLQLQECSIIVRLLPVIQKSTNIPINNRGPGRIAKGIFRVVQFYPGLN